MMKCYMMGPHRIGRLGQGQSMAELFTVFLFGLVPARSLQQGVLPAAGRRTKASRADILVSSFRRARMESIRTREASG